MPRSRNGGFRYGSMNSGFGQRSSFQGKSAQTVQQPTPISTPKPSVISGVGSTLAHGMVFGAGSQVAHQAIRSIMGPNYQTNYSEQLSEKLPSRYHTRPNQQPEQLPCMKEINEFAQCIQQNESDISNCQFFSSQLKECKEEAEKRHH